MRENRSPACATAHSRRNPVWLSRSSAPPPHSRLIKLLRVAFGALWPRNWITNSNWSVAICSGEELRRLVELRGAGPGNMSRVFFRELGGHNRLRSRICALSRSVSTVAQDAGVQKTGRRGGIAGVVAVLAGVSLVGGSYYAMKLQPQPRPLPPATVQNLPPPAIQPPSPFAPPAVSARDELVQRIESLKSELNALRKQKRDKLIDMKKKAIKEDIQTIQSALASYDKQS